MNLREYYHLKKDTFTVNPDTDAEVYFGGTELESRIRERILRDLEPLNRGRDKSNRITYDSLWVHAKRHYDAAAVMAYFKVWLHKQLIKALDG